MTAVFTGIVEELGEVVERSTTRRGSTLRGPLVTADAAPRRLDRGQRRLPDRRRRGRRHLHRRRHGRDARRSSLGSRRAPATRSTWSAPPPWPPGWAATSCRATSTAIGHAAVPDARRRLGDVRVRAAAAAGPVHGGEGLDPVDGISLTVVDGRRRRRSRVGLIPTTLALTTLGPKAGRRPVNLEVDVIAKYVETPAHRGRRTGGVSQMSVFGTVEHAIADDRRGPAGGRGRRRGPGERGRPDLRRRAGHAGAGRASWSATPSGYICVAADRGRLRPAGPAADVPHQPGPQAAPRTP